MIFLQFQISELAGFLKYGISGLSAIAFILSFFLLSRESGRPKPRPEILKSIRMFMWLTLVLGLVSAVAVIMNPSDNKPNETPTTKPKTSPKKSFVKELLTPRQVWQVEVFYEADAEPLAQQLSDDLTAYKDYQPKLTALTAKRKRELGVRNSQIRYENTEKQAATQINQRLQKVLPQDVSLTLKQISSSSPDYISVFVCQ
jgi:hypothetical protein